MKRALLLAAALAFHAGAHAQFVQQVPTVSAVPPTLEVMRLAPQLVAFAGGDANFAALVNGLALGQPVTLTTPLANGGSQVASFTPTGPMSALQIAQVLEGARQSLISRGIATPTAQQLAATLVGGSLNTNLGPTPVTGVIAQQSPAVAVQGRTAPNGATSAAGGSTARGNTSDSLFPRGISDTPPQSTPGVTAPASGQNATRVAPLTPAAPGVPRALPPVSTGSR
ncbi:MAG TPA: hypothetical protein VM183_14540 [Burkholderiales bacterium]|nr:hypothetical protein [Burkholderiales bacterium]